MNGDPIIHSLLDTDLYKFTMMQAILHHHPAAQAEYAFTCRNEPARPLARLLAAVEGELDHLCTLRFAEDELAYLSSLPYLKPDFIDFLRLFQLQRRFIEVSVPAAQPAGLAIRVRGPMLHCMLFEIYVLAIVNELYFREVPQAAALAEGERRLEQRVALLRDFASEPPAATPLTAEMTGLGTLSNQVNRPGTSVVVGRVPEPALAVRGRAAELAAERGISRWHLSLTHSALVAIAYVVAE